MCPFIMTAPACIHNCGKRMTWRATKVVKFHKHSKANQTANCSDQRAHGVLVSHPLRMRKALGSIPVCPCLRSTSPSALPVAWIAKTRACPIRLSTSHCLCGQRLRGRHGAQSPRVPAGKGALLRMCPKDAPGVLRGWAHGWRGEPRHATQSLLTNKEA